MEGPIEAGGAVKIRIEADLSSFNRQLNAAFKTINQLNGNGKGIAVQVDDSQLYDLNEHLDLKQKHLGETVAKFRRTPIVPRVNDAALTNLNRQLQSVKDNLNAIQRTWRGLESNKTLTIRNQSGGAAVASNARELTRIASLLENLPKQIGEEVARASRPSVASRAGSAIGSIGGIATGGIRTAVTAAIQGPILEATKGIGSGLRAALEDSIAEVFGSTELLGETTAKRIGGQLQKLVDDADKIAGAAFGGQNSKLFKEIQAAIAESLTSLTDEQDRLEARLSAQAQKTQQRQKRRAAAQEQSARNLQESSRAQADLRRADTLAARQQRAQPLFQQRATVAQSVQARSSELDALVARLNKVIDPLIQQRNQARQRFQQTQDPSAYTEELNLGREIEKARLLLSPAIESKRKDLERTQKALSELEDQIIELLPDRFLGDASARMRQLLQQGQAEQQNLSKVEEAIAKAGEFVTDDLISAREKIQQTLEAIGQEFSQLEKDSARYSAAIERRNQARANADSQVQRSEQEFRNLAQRQLATPRAVQVALRQAGAGRISEDQLPRVVADDQFLAGRGSNAAYAPSRNELIVNSELAAAIENFEQLTSAQIETLVHEITHAIDTGFGSFEGIVAQRQGRVAGDRLSPQNDAERRAADAVRSVYRPGRVERETNAVLNAIRNKAGVLAELSGRSAEEVEGILSSFEEVGQQIAAVRQTIDQAASASDAADIQERAQKLGAALDLISSKITPTIGNIRQGGVSSDISGILGAVSGKADSLLTDATRPTLGERAKSGAITVAKGAGNLAADVGQAALKGAIKEVQVQLALLGRRIDTAIKVDALPAIAGGAKAVYQLASAAEDVTLAVIPFGQAIKGATKAIALPTAIGFGAQALPGVGGLIGGAEGLAGGALQALGGVGADAATAAITSSFTGLLSPLAGPLSALASGAIETGAAAAAPAVGALLFGKAFQQGAQKAIGSAFEKASAQPLALPAFQKAVEYAELAAATPARQPQRQQQQAALPSATRELGDIIDVDFTPIDEGFEQQARARIQQISQAFAKSRRSTNQLQNAAPEVVSNLKKATDDLSEKARVELEKIYEQWVSKGLDPKEFQRIAGSARSQITQAVRAAQERARRAAQQSVERLESPEMVAASREDPIKAAQLIRQVYRKGVDGVRQTRGGDPYQQNFARQQAGGLLAGTGRAMDALGGLRQTAEQTADPIQKEALLRTIAAAEKSVRDGAKKLRRLMPEVAAEIDAGLAQGLNNSQQAEQGTAQFAQNVIEAAKDTFGIQSPSRVFRQIGQDIIEGFQLGVAGFGNKASKQLTTGYEELILEVQNTIDRTDIAFDRVEKRLTSSNPLVPFLNGLDAVKSKLGGLGPILATIAGAVGVFSFGDVLVGFVQNSARAAVEQERLATSIEAVVANTKTLGTSEDVLARLRQQSRELGVSFTATAEAFKGLASATAGTQFEAQTIDFLENFQRVSKQLGVDAERQKLALTALQQVASKGVVSQEELRGQLSEAFPGATQIAARGFGVSAEELNARVASGAVSSVEFLTKFNEQLAVEAQRSGDSVETTATKIDKLNASIGSLQNAAGGAILGPLGLGVDALNLAVQGLVALFPAIIGGIVSIGTQLALSAVKSKAAAIGLNAFTVAARTAGTALAFIGKQLVIGAGLAVVADQAVKAWKFFNGELFESQKITKQLDETLRSIQKTSSEIRPPRLSSNPISAGIQSFTAGQAQRDRIDAGDANLEASQRLTQAIPVITQNANQDKARKAVELYRKELEALTKLERERFRRATRGESTVEEDRDISVRRRRLAQLRQESGLPQLQQLQQQLEAVRDQLRQNIQEQEEYIRTFGEDQTSRRSIDLQRQSLAGVEAQLKDLVPVAQDAEKQLASVFGLSPAALTGAVERLQQVLQSGQIGSTQLSFLDPELQNQFDLQSAFNKALELRTQFQDRVQFGLVRETKELEAQAGALENKARQQEQYLQKLQEELNVVRSVGNLRASEGQFREARLQTQVNESRTPEARDQLERRLAAERERNQRENAARQNAQLDLEKRINQQQLEIDKTRLAVESKRQQIQTKQIQAELVRLNISRARLVNELKLAEKQRNAERARDLREVIGLIDQEKSIVQQSLAVSQEAESITRAQVGTLSQIKDLKNQTLDIQKRINQQELAKGILEGRSAETVRRVEESLAKIERAQQATTEALRGYSDQLSIAEQSIQNNLDALQQQQEVARATAQLNEQKLEAEIQRREKILELIRRAQTDQNASVRNAALESLRTLFGDAAAQSPAEALDKLAAAQRELAEQQRRARQEELDFEEKRQAAQKELNRLALIRSVIEAKTQEAALRTQLAQAKLNAQIVKSQGFDTRAIDQSIVTAETTLNTASQTQNALLSGSVSRLLGNSNLGQLLQSLINDQRANPAAIQTLADQEIGTVKTLNFQRVENAQPPAPTTATPQASGPLSPRGVVSNWNDRDRQDTGFDFQFAGGTRGANVWNPFGSLKVTEVGFQWDERSGRGFGKYIAGVVTVDGQEYEVFLAHFDDVKVKEGDVLGPGAVLGTQGRTGSTSAPVVSTHVNRRKGATISGSQNVLEMIGRAWSTGTVVPNSGGVPRTANAPVPVRVVPAAQPIPVVPASAPTSVSPAAPGATTPPMMTTGLPSSAQINAAFRAGQNGVIKPSTAPVPVQVVSAPRPVATRNGIATYYGREDGFGVDRDKLITANGERFNPEALTAAVSTRDSSLLGKFALVTDTETGRRVVVKINDTGGFNGSTTRVIDLSRGALQSLKGQSVGADQRPAGNANVKVEFFNTAAEAQQALGGLSTAVQQVTQNTQTLTDSLSTTVTQIASDAQVLQGTFGQLGQQVGLLEQSEDANQRLLQTQREGIEVANNFAIAQADANVRSAELASELDLATQAGDIFAGELTDGLRGAFASIIQGTESLQQVISNAFIRLGDRLLNAVLNPLLNQIGNTVQQFITQLFSGLQQQQGGGSPFGGILNTIFGIGSGLLGIFGGGGSALNLAASSNPALTIPDFSSAIPAPIPIDFTGAGGIFLAEGGIVKRPTMAVIGEGGMNEAVVPLPNGRAIPVDFRGGGSRLQDAMGGRGDSDNRQAPLNLNFETVRIMDKEYVSRDQLEQALAVTRAQAANDGARQGMTMTISRLQQSTSTRRRIGI